MTCILTFALSGFSKTATGYIYIDGNNNTYTITPDSLTYEPITALESSSGTYSGGSPQKVKLSAEQFRKIEMLIGLIRKNKSIHASTRQMGFGTVIIGKKTIFLRSDADQKMELEQFLKECLL